MKRPRLLLASAMMIEVHHAPSHHSFAATPSGASCAAASLASRSALSCLRCGPAPAQTSPKPGAGRERATLAPPSGGRAGEPARARRPSVQPAPATPQAQAQPPAAPSREHRCGASDARARALRSQHARRTHHRAEGGGFRRRRSELGRRAHHHSRCAEKGEGRRSTARASKFPDGRSRVSSRPGTTNSAMRSAIRSRNPRASPALPPDDQARHDAFGCRDPLHPSRLLRRYRRHL